MEKNDCYNIFVLGYDLLQKYLKNNEDNECDITFEKVIKIYEEYKKSEECKNTKISEYDALKLFLKNKNYIK